VFTAIGKNNAIRNLILNFSQAIGERLLSLLKVLDSGLERLVFRFEVVVLLSVSIE